MTLKSGTSQACASCKFQRRRCTPECPLAPYFPPEQTKMFQNAHRLFGVSNILKILKHIDPSLKDQAMQSIIYQSNMRDMFPVDGCCCVIRQLLFHIHQVEEELHAVRAHLSLYRNNPDIAPVPHLPPYNFVAAATAETKPALPLAVHHPPHPNNAATFDFAPPPPPPPPPYLEPKDNAYHSGFWAQYNSDSTSATNINGGANNNGIDNALEVQAVPEPLPIQHEPAQEYDEIHPFFDIIDDRQSYIDSKEAYESSSESTEHVAENELKSAAACFSLTSVN